jgi:hypothetical protein
MLARDVVRDMATGKGGIVVKAIIRSVDLRTILLFGAFLAITFGAYVQAWVFSDQAAPKPPLYDVLEPWPLWPLWAVLTLPLGLLSQVLRAVGFDLFAGPLWAELLASCIYFVVVASALVVGWDWLRSRFVAFR